MFNENITSKLLNKGMLLQLPKIQTKKNLIPIAENLFKQLKNYFLVTMIALLLCEINVNSYELNYVNRILLTIINELLIINPQSKQLNDYLQLFLSTIVLKRSWNFLFNLLKSENIQRLNHQWTTTLYRLLEFKQIKKQNKYLQLYHQIQFTLSSKTDSSIFPKLHEPYQELKNIVDTCVRNTTEENQWNILLNWIQLKTNSYPYQLELEEIKVMLILNIYYEYYCNNQLSSINTLLEIIENNLQLSSEELRIFRIFLKPEQYMIGYPKENNNDKNFLNDLFKLDCQDEFELSLRHMLVNLMAMILLGGKQSFLWTFMFQPLTLQKTYGFGSTSRHTIQSHSVHYDCGCIISQNGDLLQFSNRGYESALNVPAVYVVFFSTFGALAWHLLLFDESVQNLHVPILSPTAIADNASIYHLGGDNLRAKVCSFVCTRLLSTFHFLTIQSNLNDACILLTHCFEQMSFLTQTRNSWIKPLYTTIDDQLQAEQEYNDNVFYFIYNNLVHYKSYINQLNSQSEIQINLQNFIDQMPIVIQFQYFKTELYRLKNSQISLKILQHTINSFSFLKITKLIYDLSQFYLLLHQTYTQLIEQNEFSTITLKELFNRSQKCYNHSYYQKYKNQDKTHQSIIDKGIQAVNIYHQFTNGFIRPGACEEIQHFSTISFDTPVNYLVTNENHDEGDIIMRILSVLIDYHNSMLDLMENESNNNQTHNVSSLRNLMKELTSKHVSILQIANDNTGVISLNEKDFLWIEQLSQASLITNEEQYFITSDSRLTFDFAYIQSQIIRIYLLYCRINYRHIIQKYQCHTKGIKSITNIEHLDLDENYLVRLNVDQIENEWNHLKDMLLDKLYQSHNLLRQIALTLKKYSNKLSSINLFEFVRMTDHDNDILPRLEQYEIKDFQLCYIDHVIEIYAKSVSGFQHLFTDVSALLRVSIDSQLNNEIIQKFNENIINIDYKNDIDEIQEKIQTITEFLNELKTIEDTLLQQSTQSLIEICQYLSIDSTLLSLIPYRIKCENYVDLYIHLIRTRSKLQEQKLNIEEQERNLWNEDFNSESDKQTLKQRQNNNDSHNWEISMTNIKKSTVDLTLENNLFDINQPSMKLSKDDSDTDIEYTSLITLNLKKVPYTSSIFIQQIHKYREELPTPSITVKSIQKITIVCPNGELKTYIWKPEKFCEKLNKLFEKQYDHNLFVVVDKNEIFVDFTKNNYCLPYEPLLKYYIIEKQLLIQIQIQFRAQIYEYFTTSKCTISTIIQHFIDDNQLKKLSSDIILCFYDEYGKCINDGTISDVFKKDQKIILIFVTEETLNTSFLYEFVLQSNTDQNQITNLFYPTTKWKQINQWLKSLSYTIDPSVHGYAFLIREKKKIIDNNQTISSTIDHTESMIIDIINQNLLTKVIFTFETRSQSIYALKSMKISSLLNNENILEKLNLTDIFSDDFLLVLKEANEQILTKDDLKKSIGIYSTIENQSIHFQILITIQITKYDDKEQIKLHLSNRNITMEQLLHLTEKSIDIYKYFASIDTKRIINSNEMLSNLNKTKFILVKENETCLVSIKKSNDLQLININDEENQQYQRFTSFSTIADINKEIRLDILHQYLLYSNDFVPSINIQLISFQSESPIQFIVIDQNLPATVTIQNSEENKSIHFNCKLSITIKRLHEIACQLFGVNAEFYCLTMKDAISIDNDISLEDFEESMTEFQFQMISTASLYCSIRYYDQNVTLPCRQSTLITTIVKETLQKLHVLEDNINMYELIVLNDTRTQIYFDLSIGEILELFSMDLTTLSLELKRK